MTDLQYDVIEDSAPPEPSPQTMTRWLAGGLVIALLAVLGLGAWIYSDRHHTAGQQKALAAATAYIDAVNRHDMKGIKAAQTVDNSWMSVSNGVVVDGPYRVGALVVQERDWLSAGMHLATVGTPLVVNDAQVVVPTSLTFSVDPSAGEGGSGVITYTLRDNGTGLKVTSVVFAMTSFDG